MIIQSDSISMNSRRSYQSSQASYSKIVRSNSSGSVVFSLQNAQFSQESLRQRQISSDVQEEELEKNNEQSSANESMEDLMSQLQSTGSIHRTNLQDHIQTLQRIRERALDYLLHILFGREYNEYNNMVSQNSDSGQAYTFTYYSEQETTNFDAKGIVRTADGREIPFQMNVEMSRSFTEMTESYIDFSTPRFCDPLVINLDNNIAEVSDQKFLFDLDADGNEESISMLDSRSGYLAFDKNGDGIINDGSELFGVSSGNGFSDLAQYDMDHNGWIDEADEIFSKLCIWVKNADGSDRLTKLSEAGVGAIHLGSRDTEFAQKSLIDNHTNGAIRKTGMFLYENGQVGTVQQLDLAT